MPGNEGGIGMDIASMQEIHIASISKQQQALLYPTLKGEKQGVLDHQWYIFAITLNIHRCQHIDAVLGTDFKVVHHGAVLSIDKHAERRLATTTELDTAYAQRILVAVTHHELCSWRHHLGKECVERDCIARELQTQ